MTEFTGEQAFEMVLARLSETYRDTAGNRARIESLKLEKEDALREVTRCREERNAARKERDEALKKAQAGEKLWQAVNAFPVFFKEDPTGALEKLQKACKETEQDLDPDALPF